MILFVVGAVEAPGGVVLLPWALYFFGLPPLLGGLTCWAIWAFALRFALPTFTSSCLCLSAFVLEANSADKSFYNFNKKIIKINLDEYVLLF